MSSPAGSDDGSSGARGTAGRRSGEVGGERVGDEGEEAPEAEVDMAWRGAARLKRPK
jgi:hypothetical protein